jgi:phospholipid N-methyltransferase
MPCRLIHRYQHSHDFVACIFWVDYKDDAVWVIHKVLGTEGQEGDRSQQMMEVALCGVPLTLLEHTENEKK